MEYLKYNREERDICAHLFRLLLEDQPNWGPLKTFLGKESLESPRLFCEAALLRDAYFERKAVVEQREALLKSVCELIAGQEKVTEYTDFMNLPDRIRDPKQTHPRQVRFKLQEHNAVLSENDNKVYGALQGMFNAKPDLVICEGTTLHVYEAKYTLGFDKEQLARTQKIAEVWAKLLYEDLGFDSEPLIQLRTLGLAKFEPNISWKKVLEIAQERWGDEDFSVKVFSKVLLT